MLCDSATLYINPVSAKAEKKTRMSNSYISSKNNESYIKINSC